MFACRAGVPEQRWDDDLRRADGHFLQSRAWQQVQETLGSPTLHASSDNEWMWAAHRGGTVGMRYLYVPCGPTFMKAGAVSECLDALILNAETNHCSFLRIEPVGTVDLFALMKHKGREVKPVQPQHTWVLDLTRDEAMLRRGLTKGHKGSINSAERKGLSVRRSTDPEEVSILIAFLHLTGRRGGFRPAPDSYYRTLANVLLPMGAGCLYIAEVAGRPVAAAMGFDFNGIRHYAHAAADPAVARQLSAAAPLVWRMILDAKSEGMHTFDFWGVLGRPRLRHPWTGFTQFKQAFGGRLVERAGTWEIPVHKWRYRSYRVGRGLRR